MLGLYVHVPFCSAICNYCNFNRGLFDAGLKSRYVGALMTEIRRAASQVGADSPTEVWQATTSADTIYFGGGTPSLLEPDEVAGIIAACEETFNVSPDREVTLEANPESVTVDRLAAYRAAGVNRLSIGVQSLRNDELRRLTRMHDATRAREAFGAARAAGFANISLDLMMWLPAQSVEDWLESVRGTIALAPDHLSLYLLEVYPNAPLREEMARARWSQAPDEDAESMYVTAMEWLEAAGYEQYEISNVARPGYRSRHNLKYWSDGEWLGFGCGAHSTRSGVRWKNVSGTEDYVARIVAGQSASCEARVLRPDDRLGEALFTGLRLTDGIDTADIRTRYGVDVWARYGRELDPFIEAGILRREGTRLWLTRQGMLVAHEVMAVFV